MSQPKVHHHCASMDAQIAPHDGTPEFMEFFERMSDCTHVTVLGDPKEEHYAASSEDASHNEAETFDRARKAVLLLRVSHLKFEEFANVAQDFMHARIGKPWKEVSDAFVRMAGHEDNPMQEKHNENGHTNHFVCFVAERLQRCEHASKLRGFHHET